MFLNNTYTHAHTDTPHCVVQIIDLCVTSRSKMADIYLRRSPFGLRSLPPSHPPAVRRRRLHHPEQNKKHTQAASEPLKPDATRLKRRHRGPRPLCEASTHLSVDSKSRAAISPLFPPPPSSFYFLRLYFMLFFRRGGRGEGDGEGEREGKFPEPLRLDELRGPALEVQDTTVYCR